MRRSPRPAALGAVAAALLLSASIAGFLSGCAGKPTFGGDRLPESVIKVAKDVHKLEVQADIKKSTLAVLWTAESLMDESGKGISQDVIGRIGDLTSCVSRVALSTDRTVEFIVVAVRGIKEKTEFQIVRRVDDLRRAYAEALSVPESMNRTLQQTKSYEPDKVEAKAFRVSDWKLEDFITKLILQRARTAKPPEAENPIPTELYDGKFLLNEKGQKVFEFAILTLKQENSRENILGVLRMVREVFTGYRYDGFDQIIIRDLIHQRQLVIGRSTMKIFEANQITEEELLNTRLVPDTGRSSSLKNALEVFGFNIS